MASKRRCCHNDQDVFCYICGEYMKKEHRFNVRGFTKSAYKAYFGIKLGDEDKSRAPHKVCKNCTETLRFWTQGKVKAMRFGVPMVWREPMNHHDDCYFCMVDMTGWNSYKKKTWFYPDIKSAIHPVPNCSEVLVPVFSSLPDSAPSFQVQLTLYLKRWKKEIMTAVISVTQCLIHQKQSLSLKANLTT